LTVTETDVAASLIDFEFAAAAGGPRLGMTGEYCMYTAGPALFQNDWYALFLSACEVLVDGFMTTSNPARLYPLTDKEEYWRRATRASEPIGETLGLPLKWRLTL